MATMTDDIRTAIRIEMAKRNINQRELADGAGLTPQHLSQLLGGKIGNINEAWGKIFDYLGLEVTVKERPDAKRHAEEA